MSRPRRFRWLRFAPLLLVLVVGIGWGRKALTPPLHVARFADGTTVTVHEIDWGPGNEYVDGTAWDRLIAPFMSPWKRPQVRSVHAPDPQTPVIWFSDQGPSAGAWDDISVFDEHGCESRATAAWTRFVSASFTPSGNQLRLVGLHSLAPPAYPRRGRLLGVRFWDRSDRILGEVRLANPSRGTHPSWQDEPLKLSEALDDLHRIRLDHFKTGFPLGGGWTHPVLYGNTKIGLEITRGGRPTVDWVPYYASIHDATGNTYPGLRHQGMGGPRARIHQLSDLVTLFPDDEIYRVKVACGRTRTASFAPDELWTLPDVPPADAGGESKPVVVARDGLELQGEVVREAETRSLQLQVSINHGTPDLYLTVVRAVDESGREIQLPSEVANGYSGPSIHYFPTNSSTRYDLPVPRWGRKVTLTVAVQRAKWVEFTATPARPAEADTGAVR
ncbi:MAG: hypothetical protein ACK47B_12115 [Armatimonadota bacterium]